MRSRLCLITKKQDPMKMNFRLMTAATLALVITFASCKKEATPTTTTDDTTEATTHADDQSTVSSNVDAVTNDADIAIESSANFSGRTMTPPPSICNATVVADTLSNPRKITITYSGADCSGTRSRTGVVVLSMPAGMHWKDAGATLTVSYQNLKITRLSDNKSITINGEHTLVNVSGGLLINLAQLQSITHTINSSNMSITFDDHTQRTWQVARQRVYTLANNEVVITITGTHTDGANPRIAEWGINRF